MEKDQIAFLHFAIAFLEGKLNDKEIRLERFEVFLLEETEDLNPIDAFSIVLGEKIWEDLLVHFAVNTHKLVFMNANWSLNRANRFYTALFTKFYQSKLTPTTIAVLTKTPLETIEKLFAES